MEPNSPLFRFQNEQQGNQQGEQPRSGDALQGSVKAPIQLLQIILQRIVALELPSSEFTRLLNPSVNPPIEGSSDCKVVPIPVKRLRRSDEIVYQSALPQLLSRTDPCQVHAIAQGLVEKVVHLQHAESSNPPCLSLQPAVLRGFTVSATAAGQLQMKLLDGAIADWLEILLHSCHLIMAMPGISTPPSCSAQRLFAIQHAHARCCSLLRYAGREAWIKPLNPEEDLCSGIFAEPNQRCWTPHSLQRLQRSERQLAHQLVELLDLLAESPQELATHLFHHLENISATFQICHQRYQLFNPQSTSSDRQEVFLTLILTTQRVLFYSLRLLSFVAAFQL